MKNKPPINAVTRYECGCIGIGLNADHSASLLLHDCTYTDREEEGMRVADLSDKTRSVCPPEEAWRLIEHPSGLTWGGSCLEAVRGLLRIPDAGEK